MKWPLCNLVSRAYPAALVSMSLVMGVMTIPAAADTVDPVTAPAASPAEEGSQSQETPASPNTLPDTEQSGDIRANQIIAVPSTPGWFAAENTWYYADGKGQVRHGWFAQGNNWYYLAPDTGARTSGWADVDGIRYYFNPSGVMQTGWVKDGSSWYFFNGTGAMQTGWVFVGAWYYLSPDTGAMATGWILDGGRWYHTTPSGAMQTGWIFAGAWYYLNASGTMQTGWLKQGVTWYHLAVNGAMQTGWVQDGTTWYYMSATGAMQTGWVFVGAWYYLNPNGAMRTGWLQQGNSWYYLTPTGAMATGQYTVDNRLSAFSSNGVWLGYGYRFFMSWAAQQTNYWCGPATGYSILANLGYWRSSSGASLSQSALASNSYMETDRYGRTAWAYNMFATGMNRWMGKSAYSQQHAPTTSFFRDKVLKSFTTKRVPVVVDTQEWAAGPHYNNHPRVSFSHIMPVEGYDPATDTMVMIDPASFYYYNNGASNTFSHNLASFTGFLQDYGIYY